LPAQHLKLCPVIQCFGNIYALHQLSDMPRNFNQLNTRSDMKMLTRVVKSSDDLLVFMILNTPLFVCEVR
jgi:hypothetical protein